MGVEHRNISVKERILDTATYWRFMLENATWQETKKFKTQTKYVARKENGRPCCLFCWGLYKNLQVFSRKSLQKWLNAVAQKAFVVPLIYLIISSTMHYDSR